MFNILQGFRSRLARKDEDEGVPIIARAQDALSDEAAWKSMGELLQDGSSISCESDSSKDLYEIAREQASQSARAEQREQAEREHPAAQEPSRSVQAAPKAASIEKTEPVSPDESDIQTTSVLPRVEDAAVVEKTVAAPPVASEQSEREVSADAPIPQTAADSADSAQGAPAETPAPSPAAAVSQAPAPSTAEVADSATPAADVEDVSASAPLSTSEPVSPPKQTCASPSDAAVDEIFQAVSDAAAAQARSASAEPASELAHAQASTDAFEQTSAHATPPVPQRAPADASEQGKRVSGSHSVRVSDPDRDQPAAPAAPSAPAHASVSTSTFVPAHASAAQPEPVLDQESTTAPVRTSDTMRAGSSVHMPAHAAAEAALFESVIRDAAAARHQVVSAPAPSAHSAAASVDQASAAPSNRVEQSIASESSEVPSEPAEVWASAYGIMFEETAAAATDAPRSRKRQRLYVCPHRRLSPAKTQQVTSRSTRVSPAVQATEETMETRARVEEIMLDELRQRHLKGVIDLIDAAADAEDGGSVGNDGSRFARRM